MASSIIRRLSTRQATFPRQFAKLLHTQETVDDAIDSAVDDILQQVRTQGDRALIALTRRLDMWPVSSPRQMEIPARELRRTLQTIPREQRQALEVAMARIQNYHQHQLQNSWTMVDADGSRYGQRILPLDRVGLYVPGGRAVYPSSVLMNAVPALMAGVGELVMVTPTSNGERNELVLAAACLAGVHRVFAIGGAQAIAALTYGTATIPKVDKIVGPGNAYVATAKRKVFGQVGIDMIAGPSEVLIISDGSGHAHWAALDMMAQAEHDVRAQALLLSPRADYLDQVALQLQELLVQQKRKGIIRQSLKQRGALIHTRSIEEACELANEVAPEHLELAVRKPRSLLPRLRHAGAIFLGHHASESLGDYCAGPNHVLPTGGSARFSSPLGIYDFQRRTSLLEISPQGARKLIPIAACLAEAEGLQAHADSARARLGR